MIVNNYGGYSSKIFYGNEKPLRNSSKLTPFKTVLHAFYCGTFAEPSNLVSSEGINISKPDTGVYFGVKDVSKQTNYLGTGDA